jgi:glucose-6-phosphate 1-dehydrogenase
MNGKERERSERDSPGISHIRSYVNFPGLNRFLDASAPVLINISDGSELVLFAREDYVEEAWRIADPVLKASTPVFDYQPGTWGPTEADQLISPSGGWHNPSVHTVT